MLQTRAFPLPASRFISRQIHTLNPLSSQFSALTRFYLCALSPSFQYAVKLVNSKTTSIHCQCFFFYFPVSSIIFFFFLKAEGLGHVYNRIMIIQSGQLGLKAQIQSFQTFLK